MSSLSLSDRTKMPRAEQQAPTDEASGRRWLVFAVLAAVAFMAQLDLFIVNIALPAMSRAFHSRLTDLSWVLNAYAIVFAALLVPMGRLADHFGRKKFLLAGVAFFTLGSAISAAAPSLAVMVGGRIVQAIGASMIIPTSLGLLYPSFAKHEHSKVVGLWAGVAAIAASSGPTIGGLLISVNWRLIFVINIPIGIATIIAGIKLLPEVRAHSSARLPDLFSGVVLVATLGVLTFAVVQSSTWGWGDSKTIVLLAAAVLFGSLTVWRTLTHPHALIEKTLFQSRQFSTATAAMFLFFLGFAAWLFLNVLLFQDQWHWGVIHTGLAIIPGPLMSAVFAVNAGRVAGRFGRTAPAIVGPLIFAIGAILWAIAAKTHADYGTFVIGMVIGGMGVGLTQAPLFAAASTLPPERATTGSAVLNMSRQIGSAIGVAIAVTILASGHSASGYQHGFEFVAVAGVAASVASVVGALRGRVAKAELSLVK